MSKVTVVPGPCNLITKITATSEDMSMANIEISSSCDAVMKLAENIKTVDALVEVFSKFDTSIIYKEANVLPHLACPVPSAIIKAVEVACGLALPCDVTMKIER